MPRTALIAGSTGLVGCQLLKLLLAAPDYVRVQALGRRAPDTAGHGPSGDKLELIQTDFSDLSSLTDRLVADDVFCCLGSTLAAAGSREAFERIDRHYVVALARTAKAAGAQRLLVVSAVGSSLRALSFYSRVKALMERDVSQLGYDVVEILRPSLLLGAREESRPGERAAQRLSLVLAPLMSGPLRKYRPVSANQVAVAMLDLARRGESGMHIRHLPFETAA